MLLILPVYLPAIPLFIQHTSHTVLIIARQAQFGFFLTGNIKPRVLLYNLYPSPLETYIFETITIKK